MGDGGMEELIKAGRDVVEDTLGPEAASRYDRAPSSREKGVILGEAAMAQTIGPELYEAFKDMDPEIRTMVFSSLAVLQSEGLEAEDKFSEGLKKALTKKVYGGDNPDGSRGTSRTALFTPIAILEGELSQAKQKEFSKAERDKVQNRVTRELVIAGRQAAGQEIDETADVVFERPDGSRVRLTEAGDKISERSPSQGGLVP